MKGTSATPVIRMIVPISNEHEGTQGRVVYGLRLPEPEYELVSSYPYELIQDLRGLGKGVVRLAAHDPVVSISLEKYADLEAHCRVVANYLRHQLDFGGGIEFKHECPCCGHEKSFVL